MGVAPHEAEDHAEEAGGGQDDPGDVQGLARAVGLDEPPARQHDEHDADGDVEPEDVLPGPPAGHGAADEGTGGDREAADRTPQAQCLVAALGHHRSGKQGERERHDQRAAGALYGAGR